MASKTEINDDQLRQFIWQGAKEVKEEDEVWISRSHVIYNLVVNYKLAFVQHIDGGIYIDIDHFPRVVEWVIANQRAYLLKEYHKNAKK